MIRPTRVEPVKLTRRTAGCAISASTTSAASSGALVTTLTHARRAGRRRAALDDQPVGARADARTPSAPPCCRRPAACAIARDAEDDRRVPRRDAEHHAGRLAHAPCASEPGLSDGMTSPRDLRGHRRRLAQHAGGEHDVEPRPGRGRAQFLAHRRDELAGAASTHRRPCAAARGAHSGRSPTRRGRRPRRRRPRGG